MPDGEEQVLRKRLKMETKKESPPSVFNKSLSWMDRNLELLKSHPTVVQYMTYLEPYYLAARKKAIDFMTEQRGIFVVFFLLPISLVYDLGWYFYNIYIIHFMRAASPASHAKRVKRVQDQIKKARKEGHTKLCTARPGWLATSFRTGLYKDQWAKIDLNDFKNVLKVDTNRKIVRCEPLCSMGQLSYELGRKGWTLAVTPELDDLTVGGLIMGFGIETSSHRYGLFQHICTALEIVLPDGTFLRCTPEENADVFYALPWSYGTIGFLVAAEIEVLSPSHLYLRLFQRSPWSN